MKRSRSLILALSLASLGVLAPTVMAQPANRRPPAPAMEGPTAAPPAPREEKIAPRAGYVFVQGRWDWRANKWEWVAGHWERERAGKRWNPGRWDQKGGRWTWSGGGWVDAGGAAPPTAPPPTGPTGPTSAPPAPRDEKIDVRAGYVFVPGRWDWRTDKWEWVAGHWERERAGKRWNQGRWDQKDGRWSWNEGGWIDASGGPPPGPPGPPGPRSAPPAPRSEPPQTRAGYTWVAGAWDWKDNQWQWVAGHFEREQQGKQWRPLRWEQRDGAWVRTEGGWFDDDRRGPPDRDRPDRPRGRRDWKLDRPTVSSYWPTKGKTGTRVTIRGKNFPSSAQVILGGTPVRAAKVTEDRITFEIPGNATSGLIALQVGGRRALPVGAYEVAASYDAAAEARRIEEERRKAAEAAWTARQAKLAKDRAARKAEIERRRAELERTRDQRRADRIREIEARWKRAFLADPETQAELTLHAQRSAELGRMAEIATLRADGKLAVRIEVAKSREDARHDQRMKTLEADFGQGGGR